MAIHSKALAEGEILFREGAASDAVYIIEDGDVQITKAEPDGKSVILATIGPPQMIGEMGVLDGTPRSATARAGRPCRLKVIPKDDFTHWIREDPDAALKVMITIANRLRDANAVIAHQKKALEEIPTV